MDKARVKFFIQPIRQQNGRVVRHELKAVAHFYMESVPITLPDDLPVTQLRDGSFKFGPDAEKERVASLSMDAVKRLRLLLEVQVEQVRHHLSTLERELAKDMPYVIERKGQVLS